MALTYQWQRSPNGTSSWSNISGATSSRLTLTGTTTNASYYYRVVITSTISSESTISDVVRMSLRPNQPSFSLQPKSVTVYEGDNATFTCRAIVPYGEITYQWYYRRNASDSWKVSTAPGSNTRALTISGSLAANGRQYKCIARATAGDATKDSGIATLTVKSKKPVITSHPRSVTVKNGDNYSMSVTATGGTPLTYKWEYKNYGDVWKMSSQQGATIRLTANSAAHRRQYRAVVSNAWGTVRSNAATVTVT